ncbi:MAG: radical SAM family heme chaperone HemW [Bosea sp. (in: a-proteobacteria)]
MTSHPTAHAGFGVYLHWPFCAAKCPYCDFNSHVRHSKPDEAAYIAAFQREISHRAQLSPGRTVSTIFLGGGTPSLMQPQTVGALLDAVAKAWTMSSDVEITLEANPTSVDATRFAGYRTAGVSRVSLGVQALNDRDLKALGRLHTAQEALDAVAVAARHFERISFDLIYARSPAQSVTEWQGELDLALAHAAEHLSLYQLTIEPGTAFHALHAAGKLAVPDEEHGRALYEATQELCDRRGLPAYEISNHARSGAECRHNLIYWRYGEYAGIGPGAHGRLVVDGVRRAQSTEKSPEIWLEQVMRDGSALIEDDALDAEASGDEFLLMGLRLSEGIDPDVYEALTGHRFATARVESLMEDGLITIRPDGRIAATADGALLLDAVVADLAA